MKEYLDSLYTFIISKLKKNVIVIFIEFNRIFMNTNAFSVIQQKMC